MGGVVACAGEGTQQFPTAQLSRCLAVAVPRLVLFCGASVRAYKPVATTHRPAGQMIPNCVALHFCLDQSYPPLFKLFTFFLS